MRGELYCPLCPHTEAPVPEPRRCPRCGVPLEFRQDLPRIHPEDLRGRGVWRYAPFLPEVEPVTLGEGGTPLVESVRIGPALGIKLLFKLEGANPTGAFKDRGAAVLVSVLRDLGVKRVADDSSGNAAAALSAYAARAGMEAVLFVPAYASPRKLAQVEAHGARLVRVPGPRGAAEAAVREAAARGEYVYASHNESPYFVQGLTTLAYELYEDLGYEVPGDVVVPVGGGGLLLGLFLGFRGMAELGWIEEPPRLWAVQAEACAPVARAWELGEEAPVPVEPARSAAEGVLIAAPARGKEILRALRECGGGAVAVGEDAISRARRRLAREEGIYVEPTAALPLAGLEALRRRRGDIGGDRPVVLVLTGSGLKGEPGDPEG